MASWLPYTNQNPHTSDHLATNLWTCEKPGGGYYQYEAHYNRAGTECRVGRIERDSRGYPLATFGVDHTNHTITAASTEGIELGLPVPDDDHNFTCIFTDGLGYVHVLANMHGYPSNGLRYIKSANPHDISSWTVPSSPFPNIVEKTQYPQPARLADGTIMLYMRQNPSSHGGTGLANGAYWLLGPASTTWSAKVDWLRGVPLTGPGSDTTIDGGQTAEDIDVAENYSPYITTPFVEWGTTGGLFSHPGRIHVGLIWRQFDTGGNESDPEIDRSNKFPSYLYSDDNAVTWEALDPSDINGPGIPLTLPLEPWNDQGEQTGLVSDPGQAVPGYLNFGDLCVDNQGFPHIIMSVQPCYHIQFDWVITNTWVQGQLPNPVVLAGDDLLMHGRRNCVWHKGEVWHMTAGSRGFDRAPWMANVAGDKAIRMGGRVDNLGGWEFGYDRQAHRLFGSVEVLTPQGDLPFVYRDGLNVPIRVAS